MDINNNRYSRTGRRQHRNHRRLSNLRPPVLPNPRPPTFQNPWNPPPNFRVLGENWRAQPENWPSPSEYWRPDPSEYWQPFSSEYWRPLPFQNWPPPSENWRHTVENWPPLTEDRQSLLLSNGGQSLLTVLNRRNNRVENAVSSTVSPSVTYRLNEVQREDANDPDVVYLYSVDTSTEGHFAEEVDLTVDSEVSSTVTEPSPYQPVSVEPQQEKGSKTRKRKLSDSRVKTEKRQNLGQPSCSFCQVQYDELREKNKFLCVARCGHTFCLPCTSAKGSRRACNICKTLIGSLYKIFL